MAVTRRAAAIEVLENTLGHLIAADISYRMIAERTDDPAIINEVRNGCGHLAAAHRVLVAERTTEHKEHADDYPHRP